jgi:hypothetical protein
MLWELFKTNSARIFMRLLSALLFLVLVQKAVATSIDWSGGYRIEYNEIDRPTLDGDSNKQRKSYGLNYLYLTPKIVASDGINIVGRFDIFSNEIDSYKNSQLGSLIGGGLSRTGKTNGANIDSQNQEASALRVSQLYLTVNQENAMLVAGRAPLEFGLGMTHNAGLNPFDHWYDTRDLISYRFIIDNVSFMPLFAKVYQEGYAQGLSISDQSFVFEYDNKDNGAQAGMFYQIRNSSSGSNDAGGYIPVIPGAARLDSAWSTKTVNLFFGRAWEAFQFKLEASFLTGDTGLTSSTNESIKFNSYAIAAEALWPAVEQQKWEIAVKFGIASGDNPTTTGVIEAYQMDRNYDVAMLLFNHRMGQRDFLTTNIMHRDPALTVGNSADDEAIGNAMYLAPSAKYLWNDRFDLKTTLIYAQLATNPTTTLDSSKDLGTELDIELIYKPRERVIWSNQIGVLFPGAAWRDGASGFDNKTNFGIATKAAITF